MDTTQYQLLNQIQLNSKIQADREKELISNKYLQHISLNMNYKK